MTLLLRAEIPAPTGLGGMSLAVQAAAHVVEVFEPGVGEPGLGETRGNMLRVEADLDSGFVVEATSGEPGFQQVGLRVYMDGVRIDHLLRADGWSWRRSMATPISGGSFAFAVPEDGSPLGDPLALRSPAGGLKSFDLRLAYRVDGVVREYPIATDAMVSSGPRSWRGEAELGVDHLELVDAGGRYQGNPVTWQMPAGHGISFDGVARNLFSRAGSPVAGSLPLGGYLLRPIELVRSPWLPTLEEVLDARGARPGWDEDGKGTYFWDRPEDLERLPPDWVHGPDEIVVSVDGAPEEFRIEGPAASIARLCGRTTEQVLREFPGSTTARLPFVAFGNFAPEAAPWKQDGTGALTFVPGAEQPVAEQERRNGFTEIEREGETVLSERSVEFSFHNPLVARRTLNADGTIATHRVCYVEADSDSARAHRWPHQQLIETGDNLTAYEFDAAGYLRRVVRRRKGYRITERHVRSRASRSDPWETSTGPAGLLELGDGVGVVEAEESYREVEVVIEELDRTPDGSAQTYRRVETFGYRRQEGGWQYLYADGSTSADPQEAWGRTRLLEEFWVPSDVESEHLYRRHEFGPDGRLLRGAKDAAIEERREGAPPPPIRREDAAPQQADFDTFAEFQAARHAYRHESREITFEFNAGAGRRRPYHEEQFVSSAESLALLRAQVARTVARSRCSTVSYTVLPDHRLKRGQVIRVRYPARRVSTLYRLTDIELVGAPKGTILYRLSGKAA